MSFDPEDEIEVTWIPEGLEEEETEIRRRPYRMGS